jgi:hypothetical protein
MLVSFSLKILSLPKQNSDKVDVSVMGDVGVIVTEDAASAKTERM